MVFTTAWPRHALVTGAVLAAAVLPAAGLPGMAAHRTVAGSRPAAGTRPVRYLGYQFQVPASWPVTGLAGHPGTCVRFDRHVIYLGSPGGNQSCPVSLIGATEAVLVQPAAAGQATSSTVNPVAHRITVSTPRITVTATYQADPALVRAILASAGLPAPVAMDPATMAPQQAPVRTLRRRVTNWHGRGFDACAAPDPATMVAWLHSRYRAVGIYIGGSDRACAQPNLTAAWLVQQAAIGWHFIPLYVGPQVSFSGEVTNPAAQATAAAEDAVLQAELLGFRHGTPIYYDMEAYQPKQTPAALAFFTAWTTELHLLGFRSGIYSSSLSGVIDLVSNFSNPVDAMPDVIYDAWWNGRANTFDPNIGVADWAHHRRVHQYAGNITQTHGGVQLNIDRDFLDVHFGRGPFKAGAGGG
jgi:Rv2525c-like, glycoside hydrolase-like domain